MKFSEAFSLAKYHAYRDKSCYKSSALFCLQMFEENSIPKRKWYWLARSLLYSVGILHKDYKKISEIYENCD